ncbi:unnamed protein product [Arctogadus glacialis]
MVVDVGQGWNLSHIDSTHSNLSAHNVRDTLLQYPAGLSRTGHTLVAVCLGFIFVLGILNNFLVLVVFAKFQCLWTPINLILLNISVSDILVCLFGTPFSFAASIHGRWLIGDQGCRWYGFANSLFASCPVSSRAVLRALQPRARAVAQAEKQRVRLRRPGGAWAPLGLRPAPDPALPSWLEQLRPEAVARCGAPLFPVQWHVRSASTRLYVLCLVCLLLLSPLLRMVDCADASSSPSRGVRNELGSEIFAASIHGRWLIGDQGCRWYGFANSLFGIVSLVSLSVLSYERYSHVLRCAQADVSDFRKAWLCVGASWVYALLWTLPPLLGWSSYGPEGVGTSCSVQWHVRSASSVSYVLCLFVFCLLLPLLLMVYCYGRILLAIRGVGTVNLLAAQRREQRVLLMVLSMVAGYLLCWMPYGVVALVAAFGPSGAVTPPGRHPARRAGQAQHRGQPRDLRLLQQPAFIKCSPPPRAFTTHQGSRPEHRTSGSRHSHNSPVFRSALPTSPLPYSCRSPEFTSYCVAPKEGELMHDLAVHYHH